LAYNHVLSAEYKSEHTALSNKFEAVQDLQAVQAFSINSDSFKSVMSHVNDVFLSALEQCYMGWCVMHTPLLRRDEVDHLVLVWQEQMPTCYQFFMSLLGYHTKINRKRNIMNKVSNYERQSLYLFLSASRMRDNHLFIQWANVLAISQLCREHHLYH
jgi:hypothetical protein